MSRNEHLIITATLPPELIPPQKPAETAYDYAPRLGNLISYLGEALPTDSVLHQAFAYPNRFIPGRLFGFRGITRRFPPNIPIREDRPDSTLEASIHSIKENGIEKPHSMKAWFASDPKIALAFCLPKDETEIGLIIVSNKAGMVPSEYYEDDGDAPKKGLSFRQLYFGTIALTLESNQALQQDLWNLENIQQVV